MINRFIEWAEKNGWKIVMNEEAVSLPDEITSRYAIPEKWYDLISKLEICENSTAETWFLAPRDYLPREEGFQWNEFEKQSLEWTDGDESVKAFWDKHLPIVMSVEGEYSYYAVNTDNGSIVHGCEPEYEEAETIADSFEDFITKIISGDISL